MSKKTEAPEATAPKAVFNDNVFRARTVVCGDKTLTVFRGVCETDDPELIAYLTAHPDFTRAS